MGNPPESPPSSPPTVGTGKAGQQETDPASSSTKASPGKEKGRWRGSGRRGPRLEEAPVAQPTNVPTPAEQPHNNHVAQHVQQPPRRTAVVTPAPWPSMDLGQTTSLEPGEEDAGCRKGSAKHPQPPAISAVHGALARAAITAAWARPRRTAGRAGGNVRAPTTSHTSEKAPPAQIRP